MIFVDEAGFYVLPAVVRTYAPRGQTPVLKAPLLYEHLSAISGITACVFRSKSATRNDMKSAPCYD